jgi:hypothetical protein
MKEITKNKLLEGFKNNTLVEGEMVQLEKAIENGEIQLSDLDNYQEIDAFYNINVNELWTGKSDERFYAYLDEQSNQTKTIQIKKVWKWIRLGIAASLLLLLGFWFGKGDQGIVTEKLISPGKNSLVSELSNAEDVSDRIHLIANTDHKKLNTQLIETLLITLNSDESANVRIACIEALSEYTHFEKVREGLIASIKYQISPAVISNLVDAIKKGGANLTDDDYKARLNKNIPDPLLKSMEETINKI